MLDNAWPWLGRSLWCDAMEEEAGRGEAEEAAVQPSLFAEDEVE
jgi:hypothetical protein